MNGNYDCPHVAPSIGSPQFAAHPDLIFLRDDLADEVGAIVGYLECAREVRDRRVSRRFRETAQDEAGHYIRILRMIASLDPVQAEELAKLDLTSFLSMGYEPQPMQGVPGIQGMQGMQGMPGMQTMQGMQGMQSIPGMQAMPPAPGANRSCPGCQPYSKYNPEEAEEEQSKKHFRPFERDLECLRNAIRDELHAINAYQRQVPATNNPAVQSLLITTMNTEKQHMAEFTKLFYEILHSRDMYAKD